MDHLPRFEFDDEKGKQRTEEEIGHLQKVTGPHPCHMIAQECFPGLSTRSFSGNLFHIFLDGSFTDPNIQFEEFTRMRSAPQNRLFAAISLIKLIASGEILGFLERTFDLCFQNRQKSSRCQRSSVSGWIRKSASFQVRTILARSTRRSRACAGWTAAHFLAGSLGAGA